MFGLVYFIFITDSRIRENLSERVNLKEEKNLCFHENLLLFIFANLHG